MARKRNPTEGITPLGKVFDLTWIAADFHTAKLEGRTVGEFERTRRFPHAGAAITWARRQLFHGKVYGDAIELQTKTRTHHAKTDTIHEENEALVDITLAGFQTWVDGSNNYSRSDGYILNRPIRKCQLDAQ